MPNNRLIPEDVEIRDNGVAFVPGKDELDYLWYRLREVENGRVYETYKVVRLVQLRSLPSETRTDTRILQKMQEVLRGMYRVSAPLDFIHLAAGIFNPRVIGVVQMYGIACTDSTLDGAVESSRIAMAPLVANLRGVFRQIRLRPLDMELVDWLNNAFATFRYAVSTIGHPDPHDEDAAHTTKGSRTAGKERSRSSFTEQQNEMFFRAMAADKHDFLWVIMASPISSADLGRMLTAVADDASAWKSRQEGVKAISFGLSLPMMLSQGVAHSAQTGYGQQLGHNVAYATAESFAVGHAHGVADSVGGAHTVSAGHNWGVAQGESWGESHAVGHNVADSISASHNTGVSDGVTAGHSTFHSDSTSQSTTTGESSGGGSSWGSTANMGLSLGNNQSTTNSSSGSVHVPNPVANAPTPLGQVGSWLGQMQGMQNGTPVADGATSSTGQANTAGSSDGLSLGFGSMQGGSSFGSTSSGESFGTSHTDGYSDSISHSHGTNEGWGEGVGHSIGSSVADTVSHSTSLTRSEGWNTGVADTSSWGHTTSDTDSTSKGVSQSGSEGTSNGLAASQGLGRTLGGSFGVVPSLSASKSYRVYDEAARIVGEMLSTLALLLRRCHVDGGWLTDVYTLTETPEAIAVVEAAVRQAFGGTEDVVTSIQTRYLSAQEQLHLRLHAFCFTPSTMREEIPGVVEAQRHATLMDPLMISTLASPASMQLGDAQVVQEKIPDFAFYPNMGRPTHSVGRVPGSKIGTLGYQYTTETGDLTDAPVVLDERRHTHTIFQGDPRSGKSEAAYRVALTTWQWGNRVIVLEFGKGWDRFFHSPVPRESFELWQLQPDGVHPLRWPILAVPTLLNPERYVTLVCENIAKAGQMGQVQIGLLQTSLRDLYIRTGVLLSEEKVLIDPLLNKVSPAEAARLPAELNVAAGQRVQDLAPRAAQALAVLRSRKVSLKDWVDGLEAQKRQTSGVTERERQALATVLFRLRELTFGQAGRMFGALADDEDAVLIEQLGMPTTIGGRPGFVVIEGGHQLGEFLRSFLLGLAACILYESAIVSFDKSGSRAPFATEVFWEEANKVLSGPDAPSSSGEGVQQVTPESFVKMWRDGERYKFRNHPIVQNLAQLPPGIVPSCNNGFFFRSKDSKDQQMILTYIGRSPTGFVDQDYQRFLARMPQTYCIAKFGMSPDITEMEPLLMKIDRVPMASPTEQDLVNYYDRRAARRLLNAESNRTGRDTANTSSEANQS